MKRHSLYILTGAAFFLLFSHLAFFAGGKSDGTEAGAGSPARTGKADGENQSAGMKNTGGKNGELQEILLPATGTAGEAVAVVFKLTAPAEEITVRLENAEGKVLTAGKGFSLRTADATADTAETAADTADATNTADAADRVDAGGAESTAVVRSADGRYVYAALIGLSIFLGTETYGIRYSVSLRDGRIAEGNSEISVTAPDWETERIRLDARNTQVRTNWGEERQAQIKKLNGILFSHDENAARFTGGYQKPVASNRITSTFGDRRVFVYDDGGSDVSAHYGLDYGVPTGTEVRAAGAGKVVMAEDRISTGWSVVIEHLPGVFSLYYHLNELLCAAGDTVETGQLIGKSGATGLATGPHLHLEFRVNGEAISPDFFLERGIRLPQ